MRKDDDHVTLPVMGPQRQEVEQADGWARATLDIQCHSDEDYATYAEIAKELAAKRKIMCAERDEIIKPINAGVARVRAMYKPVLESLQTAENRVRATMVEYHRLQKAERTRAELAARQAIVEGNHDEAVRHVQVVVQPSPQAAGAHVRKTWKIRITDAQKVPREFLMVDSAALKRYAVAKGWQDAPDGVEFYQEEGIALR